MDIAKRAICGWFAIGLLAWAVLASTVWGAVADFGDAIGVGNNASLTLTASFSAASEHVGRPLRVYMLAQVPTSDGGRMFVRTPRQWELLDARPVAELRSTVGATAYQTLPVIERMDVRNIVGTRIFVGYGLDDASGASAFEEMLRAGRYRQIHTLGARWNDTGGVGVGALTPVNAEQLTAYLRIALANTRQESLGGMMSTVAASVSATTGSGAAATFSGTTLQEAGVDEADLIKSDGAHVFSLDPVIGNDARRDRLLRQQLDDSTSAVALTPVDTLRLPFSADVNGSGIYLDSARGQLVALAQGGFGGVGIYDAWFYSPYWVNGVTEAVLVDASSSTRMRVLRTLRMSGQLIGSRRVGAMLYLVMRSYPRVPGMDLQWSPNRVAANEAVVQGVQAADVLPTITVDGGSPQALVDPDSCLVQADNAAAHADMVTIVGIDLAATDHRHVARCFTGGVEAFYMAEQSLYLATTRYAYAYNGSFPVYADQISTDLHKFSLDGLNIIYRGSGSVAGHLGFDQNRKSFRMGEHEGLLRVITQTEPRFGGWSGLPVVTTTAATSQPDASPAAISSPGRLSILRENTGMLALVSQLPNARRPAPLGKPGEQLYASRFLGQRGYLVTYRLTDPLYVLDLSDPDDPRIAGELNVSGYSDYLFPVRENLLLGVGKDAVSDGSSGDGRFAWYQGLKVSLIDVSDPTHPRESGRAVIGRRGTDAAVLRNHHAIALQTMGSKVRVGLPISLHDTAPAYSTGSPSDYYQFTRTELRKFEIDLDAATLTSVGVLQSDVIGARGIENDRALLWNNQIHYYQNGDWSSSPW